MHHDFVRQTVVFAIGFSEPPRGYPKVRIWLLLGVLSGAIWYILGTLLLPIGY